MFAGIERNNELTHKGLILLCLLISFSVASIACYAIRETELNSKENVEIEFTEKMKDIISEELFDILNQYSKLLFVTAHSTLEIMKNNPNNPEIVENLYKEVLAEFPYFYEIKYINPEGKEIPGVRKNENSTYSTFIGDLSSKDDRHFFQDIKAQELWTFYLSPLDLYINDESNSRWIPIVRIAMPVPDPFSNKKGLLLINIDLTEALNIMRNQSANRKSYLLNSDGYYMTGVEKEKLWGFLFGNNTTFEKDYPKAWAQMSSGKNGSFFHAGKLFSFSSMAMKGLETKIFIRSGTVYSYTPPKSSNFSDYSLVLSNSDTVSWMVVVVSDLNSSVLPSEPRQIITYALIFIISLLIGWILGKSIYEKRKAVQAQKEAQAALIQTEKMASLGRLVAGIAHELNTPIGASVTIASTIQDSINLFSSEIRNGQIKKTSIDDFISTITTGSKTMLQSLDRASTLITHFKQVSVDQSSEQRRTFRLPDYINDILDTLKPTFKKRNIYIDVQAEETIDIDSYPGAFAQVISNIINNAVMHAFPEKSMGIITIHVEKRHNNVQISIRDNGEGIQKEHLNHIFEPFFTTKSDFGGSGLGLHIAFNIVHDLLEGTLKAASEKKKFTEFIIELPLTIKIQSHDRGT